MSGVRARLHAAAGWFGVYVAFGCLLGLVVPSGHVKVPGCYPSTGYFFTIESACDIPGVDLLVSVLLEFPRVLVLFPALALDLVRNGDTGRLVDAAPFAAISSPFVALCCVSFTYWRRRSRWAAALFLPIVLQTGLLVWPL